MGDVRVWIGYTDVDSSGRLVQFRCESYRVRHALMQEG